MFFGVLGLCIRNVAVGASSFLLAALTVFVAYRVMCWFVSLEIQRD